MIESYTRQVLAPLRSALRGRVTTMEFDPVLKASARKGRAEISVMVVRSVRPVRAIPGGERRSFDEEK